MTAHQRRERRLIARGDELGQQLTVRPSVVRRRQHPMEVFEYLVQAGGHVRVPLLTLLVRRRQPARR
jgi:hypothetical protein